jgi:hypothetical protein
MRHLLSSVALALSISIWVGPVRAALDDTTRNHLRKLMNEGGALFEQNQIEEARGKWLEVLRVMPLPGAALWAARATVKLGRLREALELYESAIKMERNELWKGDAQQMAQIEAKQELEPLRSRVPTLQVEIEGFSETDQVTVDGVSIEASGLGKPLLVDPGKHVVVATRSGKSVTKSVDLPEGRSHSITLSFEREAPNPPPVVTPLPASSQTQAGSAPSMATAPSAVATPPPTKTPIQQYAMWTSFGVGAAGLLVGATTGLVAVSKHSSLKDQGCSSTQCTDPALEKDMNSYNRLLPVATAGFIVAGIGAAAGVTLWLTKPKQESAGKVSLLVGPGSLVVKGQY